MNVVITEGRQVVREARHYYGGETVDVPAGVAAEWCAYGWAAELSGDVENRRVRVAELREQGVSIRDVADRLGVSRSAVERDLKTIS